MAICKIRITRSKFFSSLLTQSGYLIQMNPPNNFFWILILNWNYSLLKFKHQNITLHMLLFFQNRSAIPLSVAYSICISILQKNYSDSTTRCTTHDRGLISPILTGQGWRSTVFLCSALVDQADVYWICEAPLIRKFSLFFLHYLISRSTLCKYTCDTA
jgi:hypothetical protein